MKKYLGIVLLLFLTVSVVFAQTDSLGIEEKGGKIFVVHKVQSKQTLYSLAKRYKTTVTEINKANPALASGLQVGQTLKIPFGGELPSQQPETRTVTETITHKVAEGETLFAISRKYSVSVTEIKEWNNLSSNSLSLGQELRINQQVELELMEGEGETDTLIGVTLEESPEEVVDNENNNPEQQKEEVAEEEPVSYGGTPFKAIEVEGLAEVIEEENPSDKYFALHKTAKEGTVIKVKNLMNDLTVYVRVIGKLPETAENENLLIKLNQKSYEHLKAIDKRFRVQLNYFQ